MLPHAEKIMRWNTKDRSNQSGAPKSFFRALPTMRQGAVFYNPVVGFMVCEEETRSALLQLFEPSGVSGDDTTRSAKI